MLRDKRVWAGTTATVLFLALLFAETDFARIGAALASVQYLYLVPAALLYFPGVWCRAARWRVLLGPLRVLTTGRLYPVVVIGYMVNDLVPLRAGEIARAYLMRRRDGLNPGAVLATIGIERASDGLTLLALAAGASFLLPIPADAQLQQLLLPTAAVFLGAFAVALAVAAKESWARWLVFAALGRLPKRAAGPLGNVIARSLEGLRALQRPDAIAAVFGWALLAWLGELVVFYVVALAFDLTVPLAVLVLAMAGANLATSLPSSQAGIGPFEFFCAHALIAFGTEAGLAAAYAIVIHAVLIFPVVFAGFFHAWQEQIRLGTILRRGRDPKAEAS